MKKLNLFLAYKLGIYRIEFMGSVWQFSTIDRKILTYMFDGTVSLKEAKERFKKTLSKRYYSI